MILIIITTFFAACGGILFEIFLGSFGSYIFGDSVKVFSLTMGVYMFSMGLGAFSIPSTIKKPGHKFLLIEVCLSVIHLFSPILIWYAYVYGIMTVPIFWLTLMLSGILVGAEIPLILAIIREIEGTSDRLVNKVLASDYIGALAASIVFGFWLIEKFGLLGASSFSSLFEIVSGLILLVYLRRSFKKLFFNLMAIVLFFLLILSLSFIVNSDSIQLHLEKLWAHTMDPLAKVTTHLWSGYSFITITETPTNEHTLYLNHQYQWKTGKDLTEYHEALVIPAVESFKKTHHAIPKSVIIIGGGDGFAANLLNKTYHIEDITIVDIDPKIRELALNLDFWKNAGGDIYLHSNINYYPKDAFEYILRNKNPKKYDLAIIDLPDPTQPSLARFFTTTFFSKLIQTLSESGMLSIQSSYMAQKSYGREKFVCLIQNILKQLNWNSQVLAMNELEFFVVGSRTENIYPVSENEKLPGRIITAGSKVKWLLTDHLQRFNNYCDSKITSSLLIPEVLSL